MEYIWRKGCHQIIIHLRSLPNPVSCRFHSNSSPTCNAIASSRSDGWGLYSNNEVLRRNIMRTKYHITPSTADNKKWINISFSDDDDTTGMNHSKKISKNKNNTSIACVDNESNATSYEPRSKVPESVLQYERQLRKIQAADRASKTNVTVHDHLETVYVDEHVVVTNKPSGILCVPGINHYKSLVDLVYEVYGRKKRESTIKNMQNESSKERKEKSSLLLPSSDEPLQRDSMIVHRLDMDTSGIVVFARTRLAMSNLHKTFRERSRTTKIYEALLVGWFDIGKWCSSLDNDDTNATNCISEESFGGGEINLPLQRDHRHPPFMRVSTPESEAEARVAVRDLNHAGWKKLVAKRPKPSITHFRIISYEEWMGKHPVTRIELTPITGRTHQLRVHCAAIGHPILGDPAYGFCGEAHMNGGFSDDTMTEMSPTCASFELRQNIEELVKFSGQKMCLHARKITLDHPLSGEQVSFEANPPF
mmetsp:Transcript_21999/g.45238  ORF Transcript_21999/g.45238 Transcript_21999/m.45238 type:complete len:478 (-) Transcript_21999:2228-3661(-)